MTQLHFSPSQLLKSPNLSFDLGNTNLTPIRKSTPLKEIVSMGFIPYLLFKSML